MLLRLHFIFVIYRSNLNLDVFLKETNTATFVNVLISFLIFFAFLVDAILVGIVFSIFSSSYKIFSAVIVFAKIFVFFCLQGTGYSFCCACAPVLSI